MTRLRYLCWLLIVKAIIIECHKIVESSCMKAWENVTLDDKLVTFIIPTKGRASLTDTLRSIIQQNSSQWLAIVYFDGLVSNNIYLDPISKIPLFLSGIPADPRICYHHSYARSGISNCGGDIRNRAVNFAITPWVGFVDDDDTVSELYVHHLELYSLKMPSLDCIIFRMSGFGNKIHPNPLLDDFFLNDVGISFVVKRSLFVDDHVQFPVSNAEDYLFLNQMRDLNYKMLLSQQILYYVKGYKPTEYINCKEAIISPGPRKVFLFWDFSEDMLKVGNMTAIMGPNCTSRAPNYNSYPTVRFVTPKIASFSDHFEGLTIAVNRSLSMGCLGYWSHGPIDIVFLISDQGQRSSRYNNRLKHAYSSENAKQFSLKTVQKWELFPWSTSWKSYFSKSSYFVPSLTIYSKHDDETMSFKGSNSSFEVYSRGYYQSCIYFDYLGMVNGASRKAPHYKGSDGNGNEAPRFVNCLDLLSTDFDVVVFSSQLKLSDDHENLCQSLSLLQSVTSICIQSGDMNVVKHFFAHASLIVFGTNVPMNSYLLDVALSFKKFVLSLSTGHPVFESLYPPVIFLSPKKILTSIQPMLHVIKLVGDQPYHRSRIEKFFSDRYQHLDFVCHALGELDNDIRQAGLHYPSRKYSRILPSISIMIGN